MNGPELYVSTPATPHKVLAIFWDGKNVMEVVNFAPTQLSFKGNPKHPGDAPQLYHSTIGVTEELIKANSWLFKSEDGNLDFMTPELFKKNFTKDVPTIDLDADTLDQIKKAVDESTWIPSEYMTNDWLSDVCKFLREGPAAFSAKDSDVYLKTGFTLEIGKMYLVKGSRRYYEGIIFDSRSGTSYLFKYAGDASRETLRLGRHQLEDAVRRIAEPLRKPQTTIHSNRCERAGQIIGNEQWFIEGSPEDDRIVDIRYEVGTVIRGIPMKDVLWKSRSRILGIHEANQVFWWRYSDV